MHTHKLALLLTLVALTACDVEEETATRIGEGYVGAGMRLEDDADADADAGPQGWTDDVDPSLAGYCDSVTTWDSAWASFETQVITKINQRRAAGASCGGTWKKPVPALALNTKLRCAARRHSKDMGVNNFTSHTGSQGQTPWDRIKAAGYNYSTAAENIAWGYNTPSAVVDGWMKSAGHCLNIMNGAFTHVGVGYYYRSSSDWKHYWTQNFGKPL